jgi:hypothetical protein
LRLMRNSLWIIFLIFLFVFCRSCCVFCCFIFQTTA